MTWYYIVNNILWLVVVILNLFALFLLKRRTQSNRNLNQTHIIAALCIYHFVDALACFSFDLMDYVNPMPLKLYLVTFCVTDIYIGVNTSITMFLLLGDRFLLFYLNLRYRFYLPPKRITRLIVIVSVILFVCTSIFALLILGNKVNGSNFHKTFRLFYTSMNVSNILLAILVYTYIFSVYKRQKEIQQNRTDNKSNFKILTPTLIVVTYVILNIFPNFFLTGAYLEIFDVSEIVFQIPVFLIKIGYAADPLIYVFSFEFKKGWWRKWIQRN